jgi:acetamidase/formamidase
MATYHLDDTQPHAFWDNSYPARIRVKPGDTVVFETLEASACQITPESADEAVAHLSFDPIHPLTGPVYVEGAEPGDGLEVEVISIKHKGWGWNAVIPGFGLLGEDFPNPYLHHYKLGRTYCEFREDILIPYEPFCGVMGVGPREQGRLIQFRRARTPETLIFVTSRRARGSRSRSWFPAPSSLVGIVIPRRGMGK